jgi:hypothetical protein
MIPRQIIFTAFFMLDFLSFQCVGGLWSPPVC